MGSKAYQRAILGKYTVLSKENIETFMTCGYAVIKKAFDPALAKKYTDRAFERLGYRKNDPATWEQSLIHMDHESLLDVKEFSPKGWNAICDIIGGQERIRKRPMQVKTKHFTSIYSFKWSDAFVLNLSHGADREWIPPSSKAPGWHIDGDFFRHFLDTFEQALLPIVLWSDMVHQGGATYVAMDSAKYVANLLAEHPQGIDSMGAMKIQDHCNDFQEITGQAGDLVLMSPHVLHASSQNILKRPRFISNPPVALEEPLRFNRDNLADHSLLENSILNHLGVDALNFKPTRERKLWDNNKKKY